MSWQFSTERITKNLDYTECETKRLISYKSSLEVGIQLDFFNPLEAGTLNISVLPIGPLAPRVKWLAVFILGWRPGRELSQ